MTIIIMVLAMFPLIVGKMANIQNVEITFCDELQNVINVFETLLRFVFNNEVGDMLKYCKY